MTDGVLRGIGWWGMAIVVLAIWAVLVALADVLLAFLPFGPPSLFWRSLVATYLAWRVMQWLVPSRSCSRR